HRPPAGARIVIAITREVSASLAACELSFVPRAGIDLGLARRQHAAYRDLLARLGCEVLELPEQADMPDAVFVEDVAIVTDEVAGVAAVLGRYRPLRVIETPGTIDGGDVLRIGRRVFVGESARTNGDGIAQLRAILAPLGYTVQGVPTHGCLHLKSAVTALDDDTVLLQPAWVAREAFAGYRIVEVDPAEEHAANVLRIGARVVSPAGFPLTHARIRGAGVEVATVDVSELQKAEGAVTCCSLVFRDA